MTSHSTGYRYPFPAYPDGWFSIGPSTTLGSGEVKPLNYLGRDLVAFRGGDGAARVFDAHCPHLGAHLGFGGKVCGDGIVCPFHGWQFDGEGHVVDVPNLDRRPPRVTAGAWDVCERNGQIFIWHHAGDACSAPPLAASVASACAMPLSRRASPIIASRMAMPSINARTMSMGDESSERPCSVARMSSA